MTSECELCNNEIAKGLNEQECHVALGFVVMCEGCRMLQSLQRPDPLADLIKSFSKNQS